MPTQRVELYAQHRVEAIVVRSIQSPVRKSEIKELLIVATEYLEILSFVCQMQWKERDFKSVLV